MNWGEVWAMPMPVMDWAHPKRPPTTTISRSHVTSTFVFLRCASQWFCWTSQPHYLEKKITGILTKNMAALSLDLPHWMVSSTIYRTRKTCSCSYIIPKTKNHHWTSVLQCFWLMTSIEISNFIDSNFPLALPWNLKFHSFKSCKNQNPGSIRPGLDHWGVWAIFWGKFGPQMLEELWFKGRYFTHMYVYQNIQIHNSLHM